MRGICAAMPHGRMVSNCRMYFSTSHAVCQRRPAIFVKNAQPACRASVAGEALAKAEGAKKGKSSPSRIKLYFHNKISSRKGFLGASIGANAPTRHKNCIELQNFCIARAFIQFPLDFWGKIARRVYFWRGYKRRGACVAMILRSCVSATANLRVSHGGKFETSGRRRGEANFFLGTKSCGEANKRKNGARNKSRIVHKRKNADFFGAYGL